MRQVEVFRNGIPAGILTETDSGEYIFRYADSWFSDRSKPAISLTLPKTAKEYRSETLFPFFYNMLSEGANRKLQSRLLKIDENDHFGLLAATAEYDTVGAITVKPLKHVSS
ncbi:MAG: HipA N-terminal domain-containing protein [Bacteroidota bacterium]